MEKEISPFSSDEDELSAMEAATRSFCREGTQSEKLPCFPEVCKMLRRSVSWQAKVRRRFGLYREETELTSRKTLGYE